ncbi:succinyl-CoA--3-ketoacid-CoA transferase [Halalkalibacillus sediminis]|uniref:Succinyl-CoA--3-ketoacid-CoA transferase n=1 Tax=Halalkalibacillus sediminis TaxID=2018042 RepID=A0A2I0QQW8_9BACI|nr:3-oxoacid CoA-transferase subunit B [Halalkalibacillus sediminis]PKR76732.1 succinyl-CoA--3-ketoacid-CoA transferase [Halalkalibacillus sediminis]
MNMKERIAARIAKEFSDGDIINLGIGIPTLIPNFISEDLDVFLHSENGILGVGHTPEEDEEDPNIVNAGKKPVTVNKGASFFDSASSFAMIRGGHIDISVLGALEVNAKAQISNWAVPGKPVLGVGGAMDLIEGSKKVFVTTTHVTKDGKPKIVQENKYPLTSYRSIDMIVTDKAVFHVQDEMLILTEIAPESSLDEVEQLTEAPFQVSESIKKNK